MDSRKMGLRILQKERQRFAVASYRNERLPCHHRMGIPLRLALNDSENRLPAHHT